jgi:hypothetical protein
MSQPSGNTPSPTLLGLLAVAAEMRVNGKSWAAVAARVQRSPETCRKWPREYPDAWRRLYREAEEHLIADAAAESVVVLRSLLRSEDERTRRDVARFLATLRLNLRKLEGKQPRPAATPDNDAARILAYLEDLDDAQIQSLRAELLARQLPYDGGPAAAPADPAGPHQPG